MCLNAPEVIREWTEFGFRSGIQFHAAGDAARVEARYFVTILKGIFLKGVGLEVLWVEVLFLIAFAGIVFTGATLKLRQKLA